MNMESLYLRSNIQAEPLFDSWYAWSYLVPPATAARNITERHIKIMNSYITAPHVHADAVKNPKMLGGPFIDYGGGRVDEIKALLNRTMQERTELIDLSRAITELDDLLCMEAKGFSLQPLYGKVPKLLRGYVELVYDLNNNPSFRVLESLLYRSKFYQRSAQSLLLSVINGDDRPFVLSTPRLESDNAVRLPVSFDDGVIDWLFSLKRHPCSWDQIRDRLSVSSRQHPALRAMFTPVPPPQYQTYQGSGVRWRYFGHACILVETSSVKVLFDPVLSYTYENEISRYTYDDLPDDIDFVVITHNHQDHVLFETLLQIRHKARRFIVPQSSSGALQDPSLKLLLESVGCHNVLELRPMETIDFEGGSIVGLPFLGEHADLDIRSKLAYLVRFGSRSLMFLADSCNIEPLLYDHLHAEVGDVDVLFLGMECDGAPLSWLYGPLLTRRLDRAMDMSRRLAGSDCRQGMDIVKRFNCKEVYVYAMGQEPWLNYVMSLKYSEQSRPIVESNQLTQECRSLGICAERLFGEKEILIEKLS